MPNKSQSILLGGSAAGVAAVLSGLIPTFGDCLACVLYIAAGTLAVWHYTDRHQLALKGGQGLSLGALAGIAAGIVQTILDRLLAGIGLKPSFEQELQQGFEQSGMDPAQLDQLMEWFSSPLAYVGIILIGLVISAILGGVGGAIGASVFKRDSGVLGEPARPADSARPADQAGSTDPTHPSDTPPPSDPPY